MFLLLIRSLLSVLGPTLLAAADHSEDYLNLYTVALFHERFASVCRDYGLHAGYQGQLAWTGWPSGSRPEQAPFPWSYRWCATGAPPPSLNWVLFDFVAYRSRQPAIRKLLERLVQEPKEPAVFKGDRGDAEAVRLHAFNLIHYRLAKLINDSTGLCVYSRGPLGRHADLGRYEFCLPEAPNPSLTWTITQIFDNLVDGRNDQDLICQISATLTKQPDTVATYRAMGTPLYFSVSHIIEGHTVDDNVLELRRERGGKISIRELLDKLQEVPKTPAD
jgi:hypothetical protein